MVGFSPPTLKSVCVWGGGGGGLCRSVHGRTSQGGGQRGQLHALPNAGKTVPNSGKARRMCKILGKSTPLPPPLNQRVYSLSQIGGAPLLRAAPLPLDSPLLASSSPSLQQGSFQQRCPLVFASTTNFTIYPIDIYIYIHT